MHIVTVLYCNITIFQCVVTPSEEKSRHEWTSGEKYIMEGQYVASFNPFNTKCILRTYYSLLGNYYDNNIKAS